ncbi:MAG TPA: ATP-binding protein [Terriglobales bacterium]|nr:ATP-binding protein [Terriglobales bacterium]
MKDLSLRARQKGLELDCRIHPDTPQVIAGDPVRLRQILMNLVGNAIKFTEQGEVTVQVEPHAGGEGEIWLHFRVADTGIGIPAAKQAAIFDAFIQADGSTARRYGGTGLGLTISRRLVEMMRGRIWMESEVGRGTTIHFTACFGAGEAAPAPEDVEPAASPVPAIAGERALAILLVEDNVVNQKLAVNLLAKQGHRVTVAKNGHEALAASDQHRFDIVLMDVQMPEMDGFEATRAIRAREQGTAGHLPIIAITAHAMKGDCDRCLEAGMDGYISKPINTSALFHAIERAMAVAPAGLPVPQPAKN